MTYKVKIEAWDEDTNSLIVKFASDQTASSNPDDYNAAALQPVIAWGNLSDEGQIKRELGLHAKANTALQAAKEAQVNTEQAAMYQSWVGQTFEFTDDDLTPAPTPDSGEVVL